MLCTVHLNITGNIFLHFEKLSVGKQIQQVYKSIVNINICAAVLYVYM